MTERIYRDCVFRGGTLDGRTLNVDTTRPYLEIPDPQVSELVGGAGISEQAREQKIPTTVYHRVCLLRYGRNSTYTQEYHADDYLPLTASDIVKRNEDWAANFSKELHLRS